MGIPSYFSYIIRNHPEIITNLEQLFQSAAFRYTSSSSGAEVPQPTTPKFQHLFFDANSIIYDAFHTISAQHRIHPISQIEDATVFFPLITQRVIEMLEKHIHYIHPTETLFIAFDGLPPPAKIVQQKSRRFKTRHLEQMVKQIHQRQQRPDEQPTATSHETNFPWQTTMITPGTPFMKYLSNHLTIHFETRWHQTPETPPIQILSTSIEPGEGEHKIFRFIRSNPPKPTDKIALYGLDSDLIMLSLLSVPNIYIFREAPAFLASKIDDILQKIHPTKHKFSHNQQSSPQKNNPQPLATKTEDIPPYFLNINLLANAIHQAQRYPHQPQTQQTQQTNPVYDYVFMCFLLGNDFLPHIPALNLRTNGLNTLLKYYQQKRQSPLQLIEPMTQQIQWNQLHQLLQPIAKSERELLLQDNVAFRKMPKPSLSAEKMKTPNEIQEFITSCPQFYTAAREYIRPEIEANWQQRYRRVFPTACPLRFLKQMRDTWEYYLGRLAVLEYTTDAPPLLGDVVETLQNFHTQQIDSIAPLEHLVFDTDEDYLAYVLSDTPMTYDMTFSKMLWEVHVH